MNKSIIFGALASALAFASGSLITHIISKKKETKTKKKYDKLYAGNVLCVMNEDTEEIDLYLQVTADIKDIVNSDSVTFKVKTKQVEPKEHIYQA